MSYDAERLAIETYFDVQWADRTPLGLDGHKFEPVSDSIQLNIQNGLRLQGSIGRVNNRINNMGQVVITIFSEGGEGSVKWRTRADEVVSLFHEKALLIDGSLATGPENMFVRFSPPEAAPNHHPYVMANRPETPLRITQIAAPFVRYTYD